MADLTWFRLGGPARMVVSPADVDSLMLVLRRSRDVGAPAKVLGAGANVLAPDRGFDGVVIQLTDPAMCRVDFDGPVVRTGAGADLVRLCNVCARRHYSGLEPLAGIPATVGGAVRMNAGGRFGQMADVVSSVTLVDRQGRLETLDRDQLGFGYRTSAVGTRIVVSAELTLTPDCTTAWQTYSDIWAEKRRTQPIAANSAGCVFKNPPGRSAGALIEQCGLKGASVGGASVSHEHANFVVTTPDARADDVIRLLDYVRQAVAERGGVTLETEIDIW